MARHEYDIITVGGRLGGAALGNRNSGRAFASRLEVASSGFETFGDLSGTGFLPVSGLSTFAT
jgi:hypothetical protein